MPKTCTVHRKAIILHPLLDKHQKFRGVAQLVAHLVWDQVVARSSRVTPTFFCHIKNPWRLYQAREFLIG